MVQRSLFSCQLRPSVTQLRELAEPIVEELAPFPSPRKQDRPEYPVVESLVVLVTLSCWASDDAIKNVAMIVADGAFASPTKAWRIIVLRVGEGEG